MRPDVGVIVVAAGQGLRAGAGEPKQFRTVAGAPLVMHAIRPFLRHPDVHTVVLVLPEAVVDAPPAWLAELIGDRLILAAGGAVREDSTRAGFGRLPESCAIILVHDGARPLPDTAVIDAVIAEARRGHAGVAAVPVTDTVKQVDAAGVVLRTVPRDGLWRAQTPQGFPRELLGRALAATDPAMPATDEAGLVERIGGTVVVVEDTPWNIKVTTPLDFALADFLLRSSR